MRHGAAPGGATSMRHASPTATPGEPITELTVPSNAVGRIAAAEPADVHVRTSIVWPPVSSTALERDHRPPISVPAMSTAPEPPVPPTGKLQLALPLPSPPSALPHERPIHERLTGEPSASTAVGHASMASSVGSSNPKHAGAAENIAMKNGQIAIPAITPRILRNVDCTPGTWGSVGSTTPRMPR